MIYLDTSVALLALLGQPGADEAAKIGRASCRERV